MNDTAFVDPTKWMLHKDANQAYWEKNLAAIAREGYKLYWTNPRSNIP